MVNSLRNMKHNDSINCTHLKLQNVHFIYEKHRRTNLDTFTDCDITANFNGKGKWKKSQNSLKLWANLQ